MVDKIHVNLMIFINCLLGYQGPIFFSAQSKKHYQGCHGALFNVSKIVDSEQLKKKLIMGVGVCEGSE